MTVMFVFWWAVVYSLACCGVLLCMVVSAGVVCVLPCSVVGVCVACCGVGVLRCVVVSCCVSLRCEVICRLLWRSEIFVECAADESILNLLAHVFRGRCFLIFSTTTNVTNYTAITLSP